MPMLTSMSYVTARHEVKPSTGLHVGSVHVCVLCDFVYINGIFCVFILGAGF